MQGSAAGQEEEHGPKVARGSLLRVQDDFIVGEGLLQAAHAGGTAATVVGEEAADERMRGPEQVEVVLQEPGRGAAVAQRAAEGREGHEVQVKVHLRSFHFAQWV